MSKLLILNCGQNASFWVVQETQILMFHFLTITRCGGKDIDDKTLGFGMEWLIYFLLCLFDMGRSRQTQIV